MSLVRGMPGGIGACSFVFAAIENIRSETFNVHFKKVFRLVLCFTSLCFLEWGAGMMESQQSQTP